MEVETRSARPVSMLEALATTVTAIPRASRILCPMSGSLSSKQSHANPLCRPGAATGVYKVAEPALVKARLPRIGERIAHERGILAEKREVEDRPLDPRDGQTILEDDIIAEELAGGKVTPEKRERTRLGAIRT